MGLIEDPNVPLVPDGIDRRGEDTIAISRCLPQATRSEERIITVYLDEDSTCVQLVLADCQVQPNDEEWSMIVTVIKGGSFVTIIEVIGCQ